MGSRRRPRGRVLSLLAPGAPGPACSDGSHRAGRIPRRTGSSARSSPAARGASGSSGWALDASRTRCCGCCSRSCSSCYRLDLAAGVSRAKMIGALRYTLPFPSSWAGAFSRLAITKSGLPCTCVFTCY